MKLLVKKMSMRALEKVANEKYWKIPNYKEVCDAVFAGEFIEWMNKNNSIVLISDDFNELGRAKCIDIVSLQTFDIPDTAMYHCAVIPIQKKCFDCDSYRRYEDRSHCHFLNIKLYQTPAMDKGTFHCSEWKKRTEQPTMNKEEIMNMQFTGIFLGDNTVKRNNK